MVEIPKSIMNGFLFVTEAEMKTILAEKWNRKKVLSYFVVVLFIYSYFFFKISFFDGYITEQGWQFEQVRFISGQHEPTRFQFSKGIIAEIGTKNPGYHLSDF